MILAMWLKLFLFLVFVTNSFLWYVVKPYVSGVIETRREMLGENEVVSSKVKV